MRGKQEDRGQRDRRLQGRSGRRVDVPVFDIVQWDPQERVQEPTAEHAFVFVLKPVGVGEARPPGVAEYSAAKAAEAVASTVVESVHGGEARLPGVEAPQFVSRDRVQQRAFEQFADISKVVEEPFFRGFSQDKVQQRVLEQHIEFLVDKFRSRNVGEVCRCCESCVSGESPREVVNREGFRQCARSQAKTTCCTVFLCRR